MREEAAQSLRELNEVVERLRAPGGCPWDRAQTHRSLRPYLLEETYETLEAIDSQGTTTLREELGDLLLQVLMHSAIAAERPDGFDIGDVAETTRAKMVHPHVFGSTTVAGAEEVVVNWEKLKRTEKRERLSLLEGVPHALPALAFAQGVQKRPARVGFDETPTVAAALAWLHTQQDTDGGFPYQAGSGTDPDSTALVLQALLATGQNPDAPAWAPGGHTPLARLIASQDGGGGFQLRTMYLETVDWATSTPSIRSSL